MPHMVSRTLIVGITLYACTQTACNMVPRQRLRHSQIQTQQLYRQNRELVNEREIIQNELDIANQRLQNLVSEREHIQTRYVSLLKQVKGQPNPLAAGTVERFQELARQYPEFEFDPVTGISKFHSDILFNEGSDRLRQNALPILDEFAQIMNQGTARHLNILVVGHTDDQPVTKRTTAVKHPTNWHLSTDRANSVVLQLKQLGISDRRMGAAGYADNQPVVRNSESGSRQRNRRVEIYVLAPDAAIAGWEGHSNSRN